MIIGRREMIYQEFMSKTVDALEVISRGFESVSKEMVGINTSVNTLYVICFVLASLILMLFIRRG